MKTIGIKESSDFITSPTLCPALPVSQTTCQIQRRSRGDETRLRLNMPREHSVGREAIAFPVFDDLTRRIIVGAPKQGGGEVNTAKDRVKLA